MQPLFSGDQCETDFDECSSDPCVNGASCEEGVNEYMCRCLDGFMGE